jgi:hypothetical protein
MLVVAGLLSCNLGRAPAAEALPAASAVTQRMLQRAQELVQNEQYPQYTYQKRSVRERFDSSGRVVNTEEKLYEVRLINGFPFNRLIRIQGRELNPEELRTEELREERFHQRIVNADRRQMLARKEALVTPELLNRYTFEVADRIVLSNRPTLVLKFKPKKGDLPSGTMRDELLNRLAGTLWVDEADADTAQLAVGLTKPFSLGWLGWMGALNQCEVTLNRQRMPDGVWINTRMVLTIQARKLASSLRYRTTEDSNGFKRVARR